MKPIIRVENLAKQYRIGQRASAYPTLRESLVQTAKSPVRRLRRHFDHDGKGRENSDGHIWALKDVGFDVKPSEVVGIIGRNGAGKSTLLKILSRITEPTEGSVELWGRVASLLEVGTGFHPELTGRENVYLNGAILGMRRAEVTRNFDEIAAFAEVENFIDTPVKHYSTGMYMRLAFAVAAHLEPEILVADEVLSVGDAAFQKKCMGKMAQVANQGRTILFVSHNMPAVLQICSRAIFLEQGSVVIDGHVGAVVQKYLTNRAVEQAEVCKLSGMHRPLQTNGNARLLSCRLATLTKDDQWAITFGDKVHLEVGIEVLRPLRDLELGLALNTGTGFELASSLSTDAIKALTVDPGVYTFEVAFPTLALSPGRYYFGLGLMADRGMEDYLSEAAYFEIMPNTESSQRRVHLRSGAVIPRLSCRFVRHAPNERVQEIVS